MHDGREFEVIKLNEERVPVRVFAHMLVHYINHGCSHLHHPFKWTTPSTALCSGTRTPRVMRVAYGLDSHIQTQRTSGTCTPQMCYCAAGS